MTRLISHSTLMAAACLALLAFMYTVPADSHTLPIGPFKTGNPVSTGNTAQDSYTVPANGALQVYAWNACRNVTNTNTSNLFVPTKTHQEWQAFISNPPTGVTVPNCTSPPMTTADTPSHGREHAVPCASIGWKMESPMTSEPRRYHPEPHRVPRHSHAVRAADG